MIWLVGVPSGSLDLISLKSMLLIRSCKFCFYTSSLLSSNILRQCTSAVLVKSVLHDSLESILYMILCAKGTIVKLCSGSLFLYSGVREASFYLKMLSLPFSVVPSVGVLDVAFSYLGYELVSAWNKTIL
ncbi:MAG: SAM-dependent methyltransferase, partial [Candidatus Hodgkinia cicadicola]